MKLRGFQLFAILKVRSLIQIGWSSITLALFVSSTFALTVFAQEDSYPTLKLSHAPSGLVDDFDLDLFDLSKIFKYSSFQPDFVFPTLSNLRLALKNQSPVKNQGTRNTCGMFTTLGALETLYQQRYDFSEQYQTYLVTSQNQKSNQDETSSISENYLVIKKWGAILESDWKYSPYRWTENSSSSSSASLVCDSIAQENKKALCYLGQKDPDQNNFEDLGKAYAQQLNFSKFNMKQISKVSELKASILNGLPVVTMLRVYYGAWNLPEKLMLGLGEPNLDDFYQGTVTTPTEQDIQISEPINAGHAVIIIGYNDQERVYYFKNSWGTQNWGKDSKLDHQNRTPGYGKISYDYAHRYGSYYVFNLEGGTSIP